MSEYGELKKITQSCVVLCVDDNETVLNFLKESLHDLFAKIITAKDGLDGLNKFRSNKIDIVITDYKMPVMDGIEMIREIKKTDPKLPIIVMTAYSETDILLDAINIGVTQFLVKPVLFTNLLKAIETAIQSVIVEKQKLIQQKTELLWLKQQYNILQQKLTFKKQQNIIRDDFYYKKFEIINNGKKDEWLTNIRYLPHDILSGDFYTVRKIGPHRVLFYISDAMGKGLNAFVSTAIVTAFLNFSIDIALQKNAFDTNRFLKDFITFSTKQLFEDEALCAIIVIVDFKEEVCDIANFSMPPVFIVTGDGELLKVPNNNLPIMRFVEEFKVDRYNIKDIEKMLICSDGVYSPTYSEYIEEDFMLSPFKSIFFHKFVSKIKEPDDDATFIFLKKFRYTPEWTKTFTIQSKLNEVKKVITDIETFLIESNMDEIFIVECISALSEVIMNAYEHGSLNITYLKKNQLIKNGRYEEQLMTLEKTINKQITITIEEFIDRGSRFLSFKVSDEGSGFDTSIIKETVRDTELLHYRGIKIVKGIVDEIYYNDRGNEIMLLKEHKDSFA